MYPTGVFRFTNFSIEIQKNPAQSPCFEVAVCRKGNKQATHFYDNSVYYLQQQINPYRLRRKVVHLETDLPCRFSHYFVCHYVTMMPQDFDLMKHLFGEEAIRPSFYTPAKGNICFSFHAPVFATRLLSLMRV